ncbi:Putative DNA-binding domain-containing protein [Mucilaginibacter gossypiicola]|uniref:Putative DNA-binding domain-containing protein n=1 Tax=Mucilaginibacter gossypiicola TaxID=551995 RepID=A0A1H8ABY6_9SPHI|nr:ATP-binding protein [Mucilaginibacter gossypiicola]SEM68063.1 Putative DNA-binding domain-containing protein [Mucilaginibacter gossypiicola]
MNKTNVKKLIFEGEGVSVDFKKTITSCEKIARTMVSFANNKGGKLLIGVSDDGTIKGVKSEEEEKYMITKAAHLFSRPALEPTFEEVYFDDKLVLVVDTPASELKPHYALAEDGKWWAYVRVKDKSVLASKIVLEVLKRSSNDQGVLIEYSENESTLLGHLEKVGRITIKECSELLKVGRRRAQNVLVDLILSGLIKINTTEKEEYYTAC